MIKFINLILILTLFLVSCSSESNTDYFVFKPEILVDTKPRVEGDFWEIAFSENISLNQKVLIEAFVQDDQIVQNIGPGFRGAVIGLGISDLNVLKGLFDSGAIYRRLSFISTRLKDISVLSEFSDLEYLTLRGSDIEDFSPISNLKNLKELDIAYSKAKDLSALSGLINLETLTIDTESNFSLEPIKELITSHQNSNGDEIRLEINFSFGKLRKIVTHVIFLYDIMPF